MRLYEILKEEMEIYLWNGKQPIYKNPSNRELNKIINNSAAKSIRVGEDEDDNIWIWDAYKITHQDVANQLPIDGEGYTIALIDGKYQAWSDSEALQNEAYFNYIQRNENFKKMTLGKAIFNPEAAQKFWDLY